MSGLERDGKYRKEKGNRKVTIKDAENDRKEIRGGLPCVVKKDDIALS